MLMMVKKRNAEVVMEGAEVQKVQRIKLNNERHSKQMNADDFQKPSTQARTKQQPTHRPPKEFVEYRHTKIKMRCSPLEFMSKIKKFTEAQKSDVRNMGFGSILTMDIDSVATGLGYWLLVNYDEETNTLNMGNRKLKITASKVHEIFGIPMGKIKVLEKNKPRKGSHSTIDEFKNQFDISRISVGKVTPLIEQLKDGGRLFKLNFLVVWNTVFGEITKSTTVNQRFLLCIDDESEIPKMDWCSYMIDCLKRTKESWKGDNDQYNGPIALLAVLYTHEYHKRHKPQDQIKTPAIVYIKSETLEDMETFLFNNGPLTEDEVEKNTELTKGNENENALMEKQDKVIHPDMHNGNLDDDYTRSGYSPLNDNLNFDVSTEKFVDNYTTQPELTGTSAYEDNGQDEASKKAKKVWITTMDKNINKYNKIVAEMEEIVKKAKSRFAWDEEIMERCRQWESILKNTKSVQDENQITISLIEAERNGKSHVAWQKDGKTSKEVRQQFLDNISSSGERGQEGGGVGASERGDKRGHVRPVAKHRLEGPTDHEERISRVESQVAMLRLDMGYVQAQQQWMMTHIASLVEAAGLIVEPRPLAPTHVFTSGSPPPQQSSQPDSLPSS